MKILVLIFFITGCSSLMTGEPKEGKTSYSFADVSGSYRLNREFKKVKNKIITRNQILSTSGSGSRVLEKSITVSQIGSIKSNKKNRLLTVRPLASEFTVWLEGKKYSSRMKLNEKSKSMQVTLESPETKWNGISSVLFPKGKYFCFFNQIPECLYHNFLLSNSSKHENIKFDFFVIWDSFPFVQEQLTGVGNNLFAPATIKFDGVFKGTLRYIVEVEGQMILYHFSKSFDLLKISWIAQGITVVPPGEEVADDE